VAPDDDPPAEIEPQAGAPADGLGGEEGLKDVGGGRLGDAGTVVADLDQDPVAVAAGQVDRKIRRLAEPADLPALALAGSEPLRKIAALARTRAVRSMWRVSGTA
jgi:hypothetical protein